MCFSGGDQKVSTGVWAPVYGRNCNPYYMERHDAWGGNGPDAMLGYARDTPRFVRFVNMLINDSIYAVDEALSKLKEIRDVQNEMADEAIEADWPLILEHVLRPRTDVTR